MFSILTCRCGGNLTSCPLFSILFLWRYSCLPLFIVLCTDLSYMAEILPIRPKTLDNQSTIFLEWSRSSSVTEEYHDWRGANGTINIKLQGSRDTFVENQVKQNWSGECICIHSCSVCIQCICCKRSLHRKRRITYLKLPVLSSHKEVYIWGVECLNMCLTINWFRQQFVKSYDRPTPEQFVRQDIPLPFYTDCT